MRLKSFLLIISIFFFSLNSFAGKVVKTKDKKVYIIFDKDEPFTTGDSFVLTNDEGKKIGLVEIKKAKGNKAIGILKKGKADKGLSTVFKSASKKAKKSAPLVSEDSSEDEESSSPSTAPRLGVMVGYGMAKQDVDQGDLISSQSGSSMAIRGLYDYPLFSSVYVRGMVGAELFSVTGDGHPIPAPTTIASTGTDITYLTVDALFHWSFLKGSSMNAYLLGGMAILYPLTKSSNAIVEDSIDGLAIGEFGGGLEFRVGKSVFPLEVSYYYFPAGADVTSSVISVKLGWLF